MCNCQERWVNDNGRVELLMCNWGGGGVNVRWEALMCNCQYDR